MTKTKTDVAVENLIKLADKLDSCGKCLIADEIDGILSSIAAKDRDGIESEMKDIINSIHKIEKDEVSDEDERLSFLREKYRVLEKELSNLGKGGKIKIKDMIWSQST